MSETLAKIENPTAFSLVDFLADQLGPKGIDVYVVDSRTGATATTARIVERHLTDGSTVLDLRLDFPDSPPPMPASPGAKPGAKATSEQRALRERFVALAAEAQLARGRRHEIGIVREIVDLLRQGARVTPGSAAMWRGRLASLEAQQERRA